MLSVQKNICLPSKRLSLMLGDLQYIQYQQCFIFDEH